MPTPSYPSNVATVTVTGNWGADAVGTVSFVPNVLLSDGTSTPPQFVLPKPRTVPLVNGAISVELMATDDTHLAPLGWAYTVAEHIVGQASDRTYNILLPAAVSPVDLTAVAKPVTPPALVTYVPLSTVTAKGDLIVATGLGAVTRQAVGADGQVLSADSTQVDGVRWVTLTAFSVGAAPTSRQITAGTGLTGGGDLSADRTLAVAYGTTAGTAAQGNDSRIVGAVQSTQVGAANGVASLDGTSNVPLAQLGNLAGMGLLRGLNGRYYRIVAGAIRNGGSPNYWQPISDVNHEPHNIDSVTTDTSHIIVNYGSINATKVVSFVVIADETLGAGGFFSGASVTTSAATITIARPTVLADYVSYNGTSWVSQNSVFNIDSFTSGVLQISHPTMVDPMNPFVTNYDVSVTGRGAALAALIAPDSSAVTNTTVKIAWYDWAGVLQTTASTNMKAFVRRSVSGAQTVNPQTVDTTKYPSSDLWIIGVFEVAS